MNPRIETMDINPAKNTSAEGQHMIAATNPAPNDRGAFQCHITGCEVQLITNDALIDHLKGHGICVLCGTECRTVPQLLAVSNIIAISISPKLAKPNEAR